MQHDIYSLGVLLLELGLWQSFIAYSNPQSSSTPSSENTKDYQAASEPITPIQPSFMTEHASEKNILKRATAIKDHLISLASQELPAKMGQKYADIVLLCLQCLDSPPPSSRNDEDEVDDNEGEFGDVYDEDGIMLGVKYIEKILLKMQEISV